MDILIRMEQAEINLLGRSLRRIDQKLLTTEGDPHRVRIWYQGGEPYFDLFIELQRETIEWFQMTLRGRSISWQRQDQVWQTGITNELRTDDVMFYPASKTIESDRQTNPDFFALAEAILTTRKGEPLFDQLLEIFRGHYSPSPLKNIS
ncbi:hypothetical protein K4A83_14080 [Spirulina subsalsa FACHB-351]|uniref:Uncharacterized protein n=2 Tax=Spirulina subsalsa TaxID=54311 RepID=A0ABT3L897_9CYAN|nr:hypothetical protein [Spirulina subsalsa FACHB-351]